MSYFCTMWPEILALCGFVLLLFLHGATFQPVVHPKWLHYSKINLKLNLLQKKKIKINKRSFWVRKQRMRKSAVEILHSPINSQSVSIPTLHTHSSGSSTLPNFRERKKKERKSSFQLLLLQGYITSVATLAQELTGEEAPSTTHAESLPGETH